MSVEVGRRPLSGKDTLQTWRPQVAENDRSELSTAIFVASESIELVGRSYVLMRNEVITMDTIIHYVSEPQSASHQSFNKKWRGIGGWLLSGTIHMALIATLASIAYAVQKVIQDPVVMNPGVIPPPQKIPEVKRHDVVTTPILLPQVDDLVVDAVDPLATDQKEKESLVAPEDPSDQVATPTTTDVADPSLDASGESGAMAFIGMGPGGHPPGGFGPHGRPQGDGKGPRPGPTVVRSTKAALRWFSRHQSLAGNWGVSTYQNNCTEGAQRCEPGAANNGVAGDIACSGLALLCFLGDGNDGKHQTPYRAVVAKGVAWMLEQQRPDGSFGDRNYEHAIAVMALSEALFMAPEGWYQMRAPLQKAVNVMLARQNPTADGKSVSGWDYAAPNPKRDDSSVTGWNVMALKSAFIAELNIGNGFTGAKTWLQTAWKAANPNANKLSSGEASVFPYVVDQSTGTSERNHLAGLGAVCAAFLGHQRGDVMMESLINGVVAKDLPSMRTWPCNTYLLYYDTMAMFQATSDMKETDPRWKAWHTPVEKMLTTAQRRDEGCFDGSWDFQGTEFHGHETGRLLSTALCCLSLEVYERYGVVTRGGIKAH